MKKIRSYMVALKQKSWFFFNRSKFRALGKGAFIQSPLKINGAGNIELGEQVYVGYKSWLAAVPLTGHAGCLLKFGNGCVIGNFNHIYATKRIEFGEKVLTADKVYISDNLHQYTETGMAIMDQPIRQVGEVYIGDGSWIGENVCIMGVRIGKNCVIGANAVVTRDVPDYCVAVGNPAKIIKRYCQETNSWRNTSPDGAFTVV